MKLKKFLTLFNNDSEYEDFYGDASKGYNFPNVSYTKNDKHTHYEPIEAVTGITLNKYSVTLNQGDTDQLTAVVAPSTATIPNVVWKSSRSKVVSVSQDGTITGVALSGSCFIYAIAIDGSGVSAACEVTLDYTPVTSITLNKNVVNIDSGATYQLVATVKPDDATNKDVVWASSDATIVSVDDTGLITSVAETGDAIITATTVDGGLTATCAVHIEHIPVTGIEISEDSISFKAGETYELSAQVLPETASNQDVHWSSSDETIAVVDENGIVSGVSTGTCDIIVASDEDSGITATCSTRIKPDYSTEYFTVVPLTRTQDNVVLGMDNPAGTFLACTDGVNWVEWNPSQGGITIPKDCVLKLKGTVTPTAANGIGTFYQPPYMTFKVEGNPMSLLYGDNFNEQDDLTGKDYAFYKLFQGNNKLINAEDLVLPADTLSLGCYSQMFNYCEQLETTPDILATKTASGSCRFMFSNCKKITKTPRINITGFTQSSNGERCCEGMFSGCTSLTNITCKVGNSSSYFGCGGMFANCTSLTTIPSGLLPLEIGCHSCDAMFSGCTSISSVSKDIFASGTEFVMSKTGTTTWYNGSNLYNMFKGAGLTSVPNDFFENISSLERYCFFGMFSSCKSLTSIGEDLLPYTTMYEQCYANMFEECTSLTTIPGGLLPATTMAKNCYASMFNTCGIIDIPANLLPATNLDTGCYSSMFNSCSGITELPLGLLSAATVMKEGCYSSMFNSCTNLVTIPQGFLPSVNLAKSCYNGMFSGCRSLVTVPKDLLPTVNMTIPPLAYGSMFYACSNLLEGPELLAESGSMSDTGVNNGCYYQMFCGCSSLTKVTCLLKSGTGTTFDPSERTYYWYCVSGTDKRQTWPSGGIFVKHPDVTWVTNGTYQQGVPSNWTQEDYPYNP